MIVTFCAVKVQVRVSSSRIKCMDHVVSSSSIKSVPRASEIWTLNPKKRF